MPTPTDQPTTLREKLQQVLRLNLALRFVWQSTPRWTVASLLLVIVQAPLPLLSLYLMKLLIDSVTAGLGGPDLTAAFNNAVLVIAITGGVHLLSTGLGLVAGLVNEAQALKVTDYMTDIIHAKSIAVDLAYYENPQYYDTLQRAQREAPFRPLRILRGLMQLGQSGFSLLAIVGLLLSLHWGIAVVLFVALVPGTLVRLRYSRQMFHWQRQRTATERRAWYFDWMLTTDSHAKEVRLFDLGAVFNTRYRDLRQRLRQERLQIATRRSLAEFVAQLGATLAVYGSYAFIAYQTVAGNITLGDLVMYYQAFQRGQGFLKGMLGSLASLYEDNLFLANLYEFLDLEPQIVDPPHPAPVPQPLQRGIVFDHVSFQYPTGTQEVLKDVTLSIQPGEKIALVGENGSGKTTLIKLLCRLYDPSSGAITIDGVDLRQFATTDLRREISVIFQDYAKYNLTAHENIWFGNVAVTGNPEHITAAARQAGADDVISGLKHGYDTVLGKWFEEGEQLSIGEWQKVALARAFLRNAQLIILDEPTSAMDAKAEYEVFTSLHELLADRAVILISHRFSTVRMADRIYVLEDGRIAECGSHEDLLRLNGTYARLFNMQAQSYQ